MNAGIGELGGRAHLGRIVAPPDPRVVGLRRVGMVAVAELGDHHPHRTQVAGRPRAAHVVERKDRPQRCLEARGELGVRCIAEDRGREIEREKGLALGADDYVTKPFATRELVDKVNSLLGG